MFIRLLAIGSAPMGKGCEVGMKKEYIVELREEEADELMDEHWVGELVRCKDCRQAVLTTSGEVKYCKFLQGDEDGTYGGDPLYSDGDFYCAAGERR